MAVNVEVYTDGSCPAPGGPGGWAYVILVDGKRQAYGSGGSFETTNNRMELQAAIEGVRRARLQFPGDQEGIVYSDSQYVVNGITQWITKWKSKKFHKIKNPEYWVALDNACVGAVIEWRWVRGHDNNRWNEAADKLAGAATLAYTVVVPESPMPGFRISTRS